MWLAAGEEHLQVEVCKRVVSDGCMRCILSCYTLNKAYDRGDRLRSTITPPSSGAKTSELPWANAGFRPCAQKRSTLSCIIKCRK